MKLYFIISELNLVAIMIYNGNQLANYRTFQANFVKISKHYIYIFVL